MNEKEKAKRKEESERGSFFSKNRFAAILIGIALLSAMTVLPVSATHVYFEPTNSSASYCEETTVSVWANTSAATTGGRIVLNYTCCCANVTDWQRDTTNFAIGAADIYCGYASLTFAAIEERGPGLVHIGDLTIHCCNESRDCETDLAFVTAGAGLKCELIGGPPDFAKITPVEWLDGTINCTAPAAAQPDLVVEKSVELVDGMFIVSYTVTNIGCGPAAESTTCKYVNGTLMETQTCPVLDSGESHSGAFDPEPCPCGETLNVTVCADNENVVDESDETNNCEVNIVKCPGIPDLVVEKSVAIEDGMFIVSYTVTNIGCGPAGESTTCKYVNSTLMETQTCPVLGSGESHSGAFDPEPCLCGETLNVTVCADNENVVDESDETNNCEVNIVRCPGIPDLMVEKSVELVDGMFIVSYTVTNIGCGPAAESTTCKYVNGTLMETQTCPVLDSGESHSGAFDPEPCPCGETLNVTVCADNENVVEESDETNNCEVNIVDCPPSPEPDLNITDKFETLLADGNFTVNYTVKNIGGGDADASNTTIYIDGVNVLEDPVPALASGNSYTNTVGPFDCPCDQTLNIKVCADNDNVVSESNEANNCMANELECIRSVIPVDIDVKPGSCPNPLNLKSKGVLPVAVLGTAEFDVTTIDPGTIQLNRNCEGCVGVAPIRWSYEDVATPFIGELCDCHDLNGDGYIDLTLKFDTQELVSNLKLDEAAGETVPLTVTGDLKAENGGTPIEGEDCIRVQ